jgi:hypothetical protein
MSTSNGERTTGPHDARVWCVTATAFVVCAAACSASSQVGSDDSAMSSAARVTETSRGSAMTTPVAPRGAVTMAANSGTRPKFEMASVVVSLGDTCTIHPTGNTADEESLEADPDADGIARFYAVRPTLPGAVEQLALDCTGVDGKAKTYPIDLRSDAPFTPRPFDDARANLQTRPALSGDPMSFAREELIHRGYGLRPDPAISPGGYAAWLRAASLPMRMLPSAPRAVSPRAGTRTKPPSARNVLTRTMASATTPTINGGESSGTAYCSGSPPGCYWTGPVLTGSYQSNANPALVQGYQEASASFIVPAPIAGGLGSGTTEMSIWTGLDNVFQSILWEQVTPSQLLKPFFNTQEHAPVSPNNPQNAGGSPNYTPNWNDEIMASEWYCDAAGNPNLAGGYGCTQMTDATTQFVWDCSQANGATCSSYWLATGDVVGTQAEFIIENDGPQDGSTWNWPDFGQITMTDCTAELMQGTTYLRSVTPVTDPSVQVYVDPTPAGSVDHVAVSLDGTAAVTWTVQSSKQTLPSPPNCSYTTPANNTLFISCAPSAGDEAFVFQQVGSTWQYLERNLTGGIDLTVPATEAITLLGCSVNSSWGLSTDESGRPSDSAPVGPGDIGCDPSTTLQIATCVPTKTCASMNANCPTYDDCGNYLACGTCSSGETCSDGTCSVGACQPASPSEACASVCGGEVKDGCGGEIRCPSLSGVACCAHLGDVWIPRTKTCVIQ